jgi:hypothetical protein
MAKGGSSYKIKLSSSMKPYVGRVVRNGAVQRAFAAGPGRTVGSCVGNALRGKTGQVSGGYVKDVVRNCAKQAKGIALAGNFKRGPTVGVRIQEEYGG